MAMPACSPREWKDELAWDPGLATVCTYGEQPSFGRQTVQRAVRHTLPRTLSPEPRCRSSTSMRRCSKSSFHLPRLALRASTSLACILLGGRGSK